MKEKRTIQLKACALVVLFLLPFLHQLTVTVWFYANYDYLKTEVCVERNNEKSCCNASCVLKKEIPPQDKKAPESRTPEWRCAFFVVPDLLSLPQIEPIIAPVFCFVTCDFSSPDLDHPELPPTTV
jgi:hypothetical protein